MKYDDKLVHSHHWGGGEVYVYDIDEYRVVVNFTTGSSIAVYNKSDLPIEKVTPSWSNMLWNYLSVPSLASGWWYMSETVEEGIDRNLHKIKHPKQLVWYEKIDQHKPGYLGYYSKIRYTDDDSDETKKKIESLPEFHCWYEEPQWVKDLEEEYGPKKK